MPPPTPKRSANPGAATPRRPAPGATPAATPRRSDRSRLPPEDSEEGPEDPDSQDEDDLPDPSAYVQKVRLAAQKQAARVRQDKPTGASSRGDRRTNNQAIEANDENDDPDTEYEDDIVEDGRVAGKRHERTSKTITLTVSSIQLHK
jgi:hypothetical protein